MPSRPRIGPPPEPLEGSALEWILQRLPFGIGARNKPRHLFLAGLAAWENRDSVSYGWRILRHGVCDGCSLGPYGMRDNAIEGVHICTNRLGLLRLNTMEPMEPEDVSDVERLWAMSEKEMRRLGRICSPLIRRRGDRGFTPVSWEEAIGLAAERMGRTDPKRMAWFAGARGVYNESYYVMQKLARLLGCPHIDSSARISNAATLRGLEDTVGVGAPNCSLEDIIGTDLLVLWGSNCAGSQPVMAKYIRLARQAGTRVVVVNPYREPGLERQWMLSAADSAVFGTRVMDDYYPVAIGGDIAFCNGVLKALKDRGGLRMSFLRRRVAGFEEMSDRLDRLSWTELEEASGLSKSDMLRFAAIYAQADTAVFVYATGLTQHRFGVGNVRSLATLALARGMVGRPKCGILPLRSHSAAQGCTEVGVTPHHFPSMRPVNEDNAGKMAELWGGQVPAEPGMSGLEFIEAAHERKIDFLYCMGGDPCATMPDPDYVDAALERIGLRVHNDTVMDTSMLQENDLTIILPAASRYEVPGGCTVTNTERRVRYSPQIEEDRIPGAKPEWEALTMLARRLLPEGNLFFPYEDTLDIRGEMEKTIPIYKGISKLEDPGDWLQWGGERLFADEKFDRMPAGQARLLVQEVPRIEIPEGWFHMTARAGSQCNGVVFSPRDPQTGGSERGAVFMNAEDARELGLADRDPVTVRSRNGEVEGKLKIAKVLRRTVQLFWPEAYALVPREFDPVTGAPDYTAFVRVSKA